MRPETRAYLKANKPSEFFSGDVLRDCIKVTASVKGGVLVVVDDYPTGAAHPLTRAETVRLRDWLNTHLGDTAPMTKGHSNEPVNLAPIRERLTLVAHFGTDWETAPDDDTHDWHITYPSEREDAGLVATVPDYGEHIAELIVNAPRDLAALVGEVQRLRAELADKEMTQPRARPGRPAKN
ncbi:hypothetical protein [Nocardiopsis sp. FR26]|uniref:hypothetical protein n=1 Tax=Nocardiopsis sp. FR26 TaxID=2605987 RepID=UPI00135A2A6F|nr:hypothetical protein [Nocardiopsis sp. FR26]